MSQSKRSKARRVKIPKMRSFTGVETIPKASTVVNVAQAGQKVIVTFGFNPPEDPSRFLVIERIALDEDLASKLVRLITDAMKSMNPRTNSV